jgi:ABC-type nitrate/sulfonate/bicarbonate transport system permease component
LVDAHVIEPTGPTPDPPPATRPIERGRKIPWPKIAVALELTLIILVWQFLQGNLEVVNKVFLPAPSEIGETLVAMLQPGFEVVRNTPGDVYTHIGASLYRFVTAFAMAAVGGVALGLLIGGWFPAQKLIAPFVWALYAMPLIAIRPMTTIWFGFGDNPIIFLVFLAALLPITLNTAAGVHTVDPVLKKSAKVFGASKLQTYRHVVLPSTVPFILTGLRLGIIIGWIILLISEFVSAPRGFGQLLAIGVSRFKPDIVFAAIVIIVILSVGSVRIVGIFEDRVSSWRPQH